MKILVIYDSVFGNTEKIARAIGGAFEGVGAETLPVGRVTAAMLQGLDLLVIGSPTRGFRPTEALTKFLSPLSKDSLQGTRVAAFDTRIALETIDSSVFRFIVDKGGYAANALGRALEKKGGCLLASPEGFFVSGEQGPLKEGEMQRAAGWGQLLLAGLSAGTDGRGR